VDGESKKSAWVESFSHRLPREQVQHGGAIHINPVFFLQVFAIILISWIQRKCHTYCLTEII